MTKDTIKDAIDRIEYLEGKERERSKKEVIREWLYTKCIWVWTILIGWCFYTGVFIVNHYENVAIIVMAMFKALKETNK